MIFLHGGGDDAGVREETFGRFARTAGDDDTAVLALIVAEQTEADAQASYQDYLNIFAALPNMPTIKPILVYENRPLTRQRVEETKPTAIFVCGGMTPLYHQALCLDTDWLTYLQENNVPYGGTSAGAAVAADLAVLGGWQSTREEETREVLFRGASEGIDLITVKQGLGLVSFAIDVHAGQMGTLTRLIQAIELGMVDEGWALDENTALVIEDGKTAVCGKGHAYHIWREDDQAEVSLAIHTAPK